MSIAFKPDELKDIKKEFRGVVVKAEYVENPRFKGYQLHVEISTDAYELNQHEWYPPSNKKLTKWAYFIDALAECGALRHIEVKGETDEERMKSFAESLLGMEFDWVEYGELPTIAKKNIEVLLPVAYYGKKEIKPIREEAVGEGID